MDEQGEFLFAEGKVPELQPPDPSAGFREEVSARWRLPVGHQVRVELRNHQLPELTGRLELARAPALPLDPCVPLDLRIGTIGFSSRQITAWTLQ